MLVNSIESIAEVLGVSRRTVVDWQAEGMPVHRRGKRGVGSQFETAVCIRWVTQGEIRKARADRPSDRLASVRADKIEMENAALRSTLISAEKIGPAMRAAVAAAREYLRSSRDEVLRKILDPKGEGSCDALEDRDNGVLERLADWPMSDAYTDDEESGA